MDLLDRLMDMMAGDHEPAYFLDTWGNVVDDPAEVSRAVDLLTRSLARPANTGSTRWTMMAIGMTDQMATVERSLRAVIRDFNDTFAVEPPLRIEQFGFEISGSSPGEERAFAPPEERQGVWRSWSVKTTYMDPLLTGIWGRGSVEPPAAGESPVIQHRMRDMGAWIDVLQRKMFHLGRVCINVGSWKTDAILSGGLERDEAIKSNRRIERLIESMGSRSLTVFGESDLNRPNRCRRIENLSRFATGAVRGWHHPALPDLPDAMKERFDVSRNSDQGLTQIRLALTNLLNGSSAALETVLRPVARRLMNGAVRHGIRFTPDLSEVELDDSVLNHMASNRSPLRIRWNLRVDSGLDPNGCPALDVVELSEPGLLSRYDQGGFCWMAFDKPMAALNDLIRMLVRTANDPRFREWWFEKYGDQWVADPDAHPHDRDSLYSVGRGFMDAFLANWNDEYWGESAVFPLRYDILNEQISEWNMY